MVQISLVVMTFNEEEKIQSCLASARGIVDELIVVDSFSTDRTVSLAREMGARVIEHPFEGYRAQREFAISQATHEYILSLDADERLDPVLAGQIRNVRSNWQADGYTMNRLNFLGEQPLRAGGWYPDRKLRLFDRRKVVFQGIEPHDTIELVPGGRARHLRGDILHATNRDIADRIATLNRFSTQAAAAMFARGQRSHWGRLLVKPAFRFFKEYILQRGFTDGLAGLVIARTSAAYVFWREAKLIELQRQNSPESSAPPKL